MKKILCINYSQSGQLDEILDNFCRPLGTIASVERVKVKPKAAYPFPWQTDSFYEAMPETVNEEPMEMEPFSFKEDRYDLILFGYQPWFLSPSLPATSVLKDPEFKRRLKDTPVITIIGARNMWLNAQISVVYLVNAAGGRIMGNLPLVDRNLNHLSAISIVHWMMTGKKTRKWGIFPKPGVSQEDIDGAARYGQLLVESIDDLSHYQTKLIQKGGLTIKTSILFIEGKAKKIFRIWAVLIKKKEAEGKNRSFWISFFRVYLNVALFGVAPILLMFYYLLVFPFTTSKVKRKKEHFSYLGMR